MNRLTQIKFLPVLALAFGIAASAQQTAPVPDAPSTTQTSAPISKSEQKAQRKQQKHEEKAAKANFKAQQDESKALKQQDKATNEQEKAKPQ